MFPQTSPATRSPGFTAAGIPSSTPRKWGAAASTHYHLWTEGSQGRRIRPSSPPPSRTEVTPHHSPRHPGEQPWSAALCPRGPSQPWSPAASAASLAAIPGDLSGHLPVPPFLSVPQLSNLWPSLSVSQHASLASLPTSTACGCPAHRQDNTGLWLKVHQIMPPWPSPFPPRGRLSQGLGAR